MNYRHLVLAMVLLVAGCDDSSKLNKFTTGKCLAPLPHWSQPADGVPMMIVTNSIRIRDDEIFWNDTEIDEKKLAEFSRQMPSTVPIPMLLFDPTEATDCNQAKRIQTIIDQAAKCSDLPGICGQGSTCDWKNAPMISDVVGPNGPSKEYPKRVACN